MAYGFGTLGGGNLATDPDVQFGGFSFSPPPGMDRGTFAAVIGTIAGEIDAKGKVVDAAAIADVLANRLEDGSWGRSLKGIALDDEFSTNRKTERESNRISTAVRNAVMNGTAIPKGIAPRMEAVMNGFNAVFGTGQLKGITNNATFYQRDDIKNKPAGQWQRDNLQNKYGEKIIGEHAFSGIGVQAGGRFNANAPEINTDAFAKGTSTFDGRSLGPFGLGGWQDPAEVAASIRGMDVPDRSMGQFYDTGPPPDWGPSLTSPPSQQRGSVSDPFGFSGIAAGSLPPDWGLQDLSSIGYTPARNGIFDDLTEKYGWGAPMAPPVGDLATSFGLGGGVYPGLTSRDFSYGVLGNRGPDLFGTAPISSSVPLAGYPGVAGLGANAFGALNQTAPPDRGPPGPYSFTGLQTSTMEPSMAVYDGGPWGYGQQPDYSGITEGITHGGYTSNPFGPEPLGAPQAFGNYGDRDVGFPSTGFNAQPNRASDMSLAGLSPVAQGVVGTGYNPAAVAAAAPIGAPAARGMSFADMTRGITGYRDVETPTTIPNPAYTAWEESFARPNSYQQAVMDEWGDKFPGRTPNYQGSVLNQAPMARGPAPSRTIPGPPTVTRSPVYGDIPVGKPVSFAALAPNLITDAVYGSPVGGSWGGPDSWGGFGSGYGALSNSPLGGGGVLGTNVTDAVNAMSLGNFGGVSPGGGMGLGGMSLGGMAAGYGEGYGFGGATSGNEQQGGAWGGNGFSGSQGSDPSGRGGLY